MDSRSKQRPSASGKTGTHNKAKVSDGIIVYEEVEDQPCLVCGKDTDHSKLLICDKCDGPYHIYCLDPPLKKIPVEDWFCASCKPNVNDGLEELVKALPTSVTSRYGEICWAPLVGYGWWPVSISDPRLTMGAPRQRALKSLGKKFLVFYLECHGSPFDLLPESKLVVWEDGLAQGFHLAKPQKGTSRQYSARFQAALKYSPIPLDAEAPPDESPLAQKIISSEKKTPVVTSNERKKRSRKKENADANHGGLRKQPRRSSGQDASVAHVVPSSDFKGKMKKKEIMQRDSEASEAQSAKYDDASEGGKESAVSSAAFDIVEKVMKKYLKTEKDQGSAGSVGADGEYEEENEEEEQESDAMSKQDNDNDEYSEDAGELYCKVFVETDSVPEGTCVGFIELPSRSRSTFSDARAKIEETFEPHLLYDDWRFRHPKLGPVSMRLEKKIGPMLAYLNKGSRGAAAPDGTIDDPARVTVIEAMDPLSRKSKSP